MPDFTKLWNKIYLLGPNPLEMTRSDMIFFIAALGFVVIAIICKIFILRQESGDPKKLLGARLFHLFVTIAILVLIWAGARFENIPLVSTHVVVLFLFLIWGVWLVFIVKYFFTRYRQARRNWQEEQVKRKYLP